MTAIQRIVLSGGMALTLLGLLFGLVYGLQVGHETLLVLKEPYREAFVAAARSQPERAAAALQQGQTGSYQSVRAVDVHTHWIKMATLVILIGIILPLVGWKEKQKRGLALLLLAGAFFFPLGVFLEIFSRALLPQALAAGGAVVSIAAVLLIFAGLLRKAPNGSIRRR